MQGKLESVDIYNKIINSDILLILETSGFSLVTFH